MANNNGWPALASPPPNGEANSALVPVNVGIAAEPPPPPAQPMARIRLSTLGDVAKEVRKLYREARAGTLSTAEATKLAYLLNMLASILTASDIEERLSQLEDRRG